MTVLETVIWRSVEVEKPDPGATVLLWSAELEDAQGYGCLVDGEWHTRDGVSVEGVSHWSEPLRGPRP